MSNAYQQSFRGYLIDHHSPDPPIVSLENLNIDEYEQFLIESNVNHFMVYCKDHWGVSYYNTVVGKRHPGLKEDWVAAIKKLLIKHHIEFNAYYCLEYDNHAPTVHPEWRVLKADGQPLTCALETAPWKMACYETGYRAYVLTQLEEIVQGYAPDSLFLDIFGKSLCYCDTCRDNFRKNYGYDLPEDAQGLKEHRLDIVESLDRSAQSMLEEILALVKGIDPSIKVTFNFAALYKKEIRDLLDYQFTEPWAGNWLSAAYSRDTANGQYPQLGPGDVSIVYNYQPESIYELAAAQIVAQGCRCFMFSGSQHPDGTLEHEEARRVGKAYAEIAKFEQYLSNRVIIADIGIIQSDKSYEMMAVDPLPANAIARVRGSNGHKEAILGAMKLCDASKVTWQIVPEQDFTGHETDAFKMVLLPSLYYISPGLKKTLKAFVEGGGILLSDGQSGLYDAEGNILENYVLAELFGCDYIGEHGFFSRSEWPGYLQMTEHPVWRYTPATMPPINQSRQQITHQKGEVLAYFINPATELTNERWVNWWSPPPSQGTAEAALIAHPLGKGHTITAAFDLFAMENQGFNLLKDLFKGIVDTYMVNPSIWLDTANPNLVGMVAYDRREDQQIVIHIVSHMVQLCRGDHTLIPSGILHVGTSFKPIRQVTCVYPKERTLEYEIEAGVYKIQLPEVDIHMVVVMEY